MLVAFANIVSELYYYMTLGRCLVSAQPVLSCTLMKAAVSRKGNFRGGAGKYPVY